jgi:ankyrin repeat protein
MLPSTAMPTDPTPQRLLRAAIQAAQTGDTPAFAAALAANPAVAAHPDPLMKACSFGHVEIVRRLLDAGADPNLDSGGLGRPLDRTCCICSQTAWSPGHEATVRLLLERGAELRGRGRFGLTALGAAAWHNDWQAVALLRSLGADHDLDLDEACAIGDLDRGRELLAADPGAATRLNPWLSSPLQIVSGTRWWRQGQAVHQRLGQLAALLLARGADPDQPAAEDHDTPLRWACSCGPPEVARVLLTGGADGRAAFRPLVMCNRVELLDLIAPELWEVDGLGDERCGNSLLGETCRYGQLKSMAWLLEHGADPRPADANGWTPLHYAARRGLSETILGQLLARGAEIAARTHDGQTALDLARAAKRDKAVAFLEAAGA